MGSIPLWKKVLMTFRGLFITSTWRSYAGAMAFMTVVLTILYFIDPPSSGTVWGTLAALGAFALLCFPRHLLYSGTRRQKLEGWYRACKETYRSWEGERIFCVSFALAAVIEGIVGDYGFMTLFLALSAISGYLAYIGYREVEDAIAAYHAHREAQKQETVITKHPPLPPTQVHDKDDHPPVDEETRRMSEEAFTFLADTRRHHARRHLD